MALVAAAHLTEGTVATFRPKLNQVKFLNFHVGIRRPKAPK